VSGVLVVPSAVSPVVLGRHVVTGVGCFTLSVAMLGGPAELSFSPQVRMLRVTRFGRGGGGFRVVVVMLFHVDLGLVAMNRSSILADVE
jgi:hypothetical protein